MKDEGNRLVVADAGWADQIPDWLKDEIRKERMALGLKGALSGKDEEVGDAEVCAYLFTAALVKKLPHEVSMVYLYVSAQVMRKMGTVPDIPESFQQGLSPDEEAELARIRKTIYDKRGGNIRHPMLDLMRSFKG
jgi:hypothetical protein